MKILVIGSTGPQGREFVAQALAAGHAICAFARNPAALQPALGLEVLWGDVFDQALLDAAARGQDAAVWVQVLPAPPVAPWCIWRSRSDRIEPARRHWKVYVSPHPLQLAEAVAAAMAACAGLPVISLKYGADAQGMLRPDKLVVHLATPEAVHLLADRLLSALDGCPVHGVPYTAELGGDGWDAGRASRASDTSELASFGSRVPFDNSCCAALRQCRQSWR